MRKMIIALSLVLIFSFIHLPQVQLPVFPDFKFAQNETSLPALHLFSEDLSTRFKRPAWLAVDSNSINDQLGPYPIAIEYGGNTANRYPKKRLNFHFSKKSDWTESKNRPILGMESDDDWILDPAYRDGLLFRNRVNQKIYSEFGHFKPLESRFVDFYWNGEYQGVYILSQRFERKHFGFKKATENLPAYTYFNNLKYKSKWEFVANLDKTIADGIYYWNYFWSTKKFAEEAFYKVRLFGADFSKASIGLFDQRHPKQRYNPKVTNINIALDFVNQSSDAEFKDKVWSIFDRESTLNYFSLLILNTGADNIKANYILVYKKDKFHLVPWDQDNTFRSINIKTGLIQAHFDRWGYKGNVFLRRLLELKGEDIKTHWFSLRNTIFKAEKVKSYLKTEYDFLSKTGAYQRNNDKWKFPKDHQVAEFNEVLDWVDKRLEFADQKISALN